MVFGTCAAAVLAVGVAMAVYHETVYICAYPYFRDGYLFILNAIEFIKGPESSNVALHWHNKEWKIQPEESQMEAFFLHARSNVPEP